MSSAGPAAERAPIVRVDDVSKWFGSVVAVSEVSFDVYPGITGLLGPNGAGKTTLLRLVTGLAEVSQGEISVFGDHPRSNPDLYRRIGVMVEHEGSYDFLSGRRFVELAARLRKVDDAAEAATRSIERVNLIDAADRPIGTYSRGMKQRIRLAATLVHEPELLILDEPLNGADPRQRGEFQELLLVLAEEGRTILLSSHVLEEVEVVASRVLLVVNGKLAAEGDIHAIRGALDDRPYQVRIFCDRPRVLGAGLIGLDAVDSVQLDDAALIVLSSNVGALQAALPRAAADLGVRLTGVEPLDDSLESVFGYLVES
ncbi:MAG: ABC transporter ATP-binding protein [Gaiellales bacterium]